MNSVARDPSPVFICGYPKSGTTLLLALLDRHPELLVFPEESKFFKNIMGHPNRQNIDYILNETGANAFRFGEIRLPSGYRDYSSIDFRQYEQLLRARWENDLKNENERALLENIIFSYGEVTGQTGKQYWVEKTPGNEHYLGTAAELWPELRAVYMLREPRDNFCSYRKKVERGSRALSLRRFVNDWKQSISVWERFAVHNPNSLLIQYEELVQDPHTVMQRVCNFLQISWNEILLNPTRNGVFWSGNSMYDTEFKGISEASIGKYRTLLTLSEIRFLESQLGNIIRRYGWQIEYETSALYRTLCTLRRALKVYLRV